ncbi:hypothetical protein E3N88_41788 [Mikania micrantha]|uniref:Aminotransferase-like plant mobile domain-containing protein n=1 Tax=Mikania micrantha TaxID=192012 RepID=A0A5N6LJM4_9ASTR|nr:hypothetical protein E3N88_41788 [Mikania micrantha]
MSSGNIFDERIEMMVVSPNTHMLQIARFLRPTLSMQATPSDRPFRPTSTISSFSTHLLKVKFRGWVDPQLNWQVWVDNMKLIYSPVWKRVKIHDAILNSLLKIPQRKSLILWFAEKWSPKTNTFIFPWGEISITLEDMMVLGGFSVLGGPVTCHVESPEDHLTLHKLNKAYTKLVRTPSKRVSFNAWMEKFTCRQKTHEHEAFLALWLSKYLFSSVKNTILPETFQLAILLARGRRIAMAPAVLATLYRDLHILQDAILDVQPGISGMVLPEVFSPMYYVQVWIWERFPCVRPRDLHNTQGKGTRLAQWAGLHNEVTDYGALELGTRKEHFVWRPYARDTNHFLAHKVYNVNGSVRRINNEEVESFARCLRVCKLVGLDINQHYLPHRVSRQFGYAQDIPADTLLVEDNEDPWAKYSTPLLNGNIYIPSKDFEGHVTVRYEEWWEKEPVSPAGPRVPPPPKRRRKKIMAT